MDPVRNENRDAPPAGPPQVQNMNIEALTQLLQAQTQAQIQQMQLFNQQQQQQRPPAPPPPQMEAVRLPLYDGTTDVEDFASLFDHLADLYAWPIPLQLAKLKTSLTGKAAECGRPNNIGEIFQALRTRFGITPAEAKRRLMAMKPGQNDRLREMADRIKKLTDLAYPQLNNNIKGTLALDQFKRCVSTEMSVFMVSRPPNNLDEAVAICCEFASAGGKSKRPHLAAMNTDDDICEIQAAEMKKTPRAVTTDDLKEMINTLETSMTKAMQQLMTTCADAIKREVSNSTPKSRPRGNFQNTKKKEPTTPEESAPKRKPPPSPCHICNEMHWIRDCPLRNKEFTPKGSGGAPKQQENYTGPRQ
jgi:hypothetical protein